MALNAKQKLFVKHYLATKNATQAAIAAGYSADSARQMAAQNMSKPAIRAAVQMGLAKQEQDLDKKAALLGVTKERMIQELALTAFSDMKDYAQVNERGGVTFTATHTLAPGKSKAIKRLSESTSQHGGSTSLELHSRDKAQDLLCKIMGWTKNDLNLNMGGNGVQVVLTMPANGSEAPKKEKK